MISIVVIRNKKGKVIFSESSNYAELIIIVHINKEYLTNNDIQKLEFECESLNFSREEVEIEIKIRDLIDFNFEMLSVKEEIYDFNEEGILEKIE